MESSGDPLSHIGDRDLNFSQYANMINNSKTDNATLQKLTSGSMCGSVLRNQSRVNQSWVLCNLNFFLSLPTKVKIQFNSTDMEKMKNAVSLRDAYLDELKSVWMNTSSSDRISNILVYINNSTNAKGMYNGNAYTPTTFSVQSDLIAEAKILETRMKTFLDRFNATEYPVIGKIPIGFSDMVAIFPVALSISFFYVITILRDNIRLRNNFRKKFKQ